MDLISESSNLTPYGAFALLLCCVGVLAVRRKHVLVPLLAVCLFVTIGQQVMVGTFNLSVVRIVLAVALVRVAIRGESHVAKLGLLDTAVILWVLARVVFYTLLWRTFGAFAMRVGHAYDVLGFYFLSRAVVRDAADVRLTLRAICLMVVPLAAALLVEKLTGHNMFAALGGVPEVSVVRNGAVRAQGPFRHPILAGMLGATLLPVLVGLWEPSLPLRQRSRIAAGVLGCSVIAVVSASSGALLSCVAVAVGLIAWAARERMREVMALVVLSLIAVDVVMKAPIWFLLARASEVVGGTGWHRAMLINQAVVYFRDWWLTGTRYTAHWMPYQLAVDPTKSDITNQYIAEGVNGGLATMVCFVLVMASGFSGVGRARRGRIGRRGDEWLSWSLGVSLFAHSVAFLSVSYFDQTFLIFVMLLSFISSVAERAVGRVHLGLDACVEVGLPSLPT